MKTIDWTKLYKTYKGLWVALDKDNETVIGKGATPAQALAEARSKGFAEAAITFVPQEVVAFAGIYERTVHEAPARI